MNLNDVLEHYGTKGMKWGVRKSRVPKQGPSGDARDAHRSFIKATVSGPQALSNKELQALNQRLNLEQNYQKLSYNPGPFKKALDSMTKLVKTGKSIDDAITFVNGPTGKAISASLGKKAAKGAAKAAT